LYLKKKGLSEISIRRTIAYCKELGYINDREYAATFTRDMLRLNRYGIQKIRFQLVKRGISKDIIEDILENQITEAGQYQIALGLAQKKANMIRDKNRPKEKLYSYLRQRGFKYSIIQRVLKEVL
jgi:regulatory protein